MDGKFNPMLLTVQSLMNDCLSTVLTEEINCVGAGRTDTEFMLNK